MPSDPTPLTPEERADHLARLLPWYWRGDAVYLRGGTDSYLGTVAPALPWRERHDAAAALVRARWEEDDRLFREALARVEGERDAAIRTVAAYECAARQTWLLGVSDQDHAAVVGERDTARAEADRRGALLDTLRLDHERRGVLLEGAVRERDDHARENAGRRRVLAAYDATTNALPPWLRVLVSNAHPFAYNGEPLSEAVLAEAVEAADPIREDRDRLRVAARAVVAAWDRPNAMPSFGAAIAGLRNALAGRGVTPIDHALAQHVVSFEYVNHAGKDSTRHVVLTAKSLRFEQELPYYPEPEWLMDGFDLDKRAKRTFALCKMRNVRRA